MRLTPMVIGLLVLPAPGMLAAQTAGEWPVYGRDVYGTRYAPLTQINRENVDRLTVAWTYRTGETAYESRSEPAVEATPVMIDGLLYVSTPFGRVMALDPATGAERWVFDAQIDRNVGYGDFTNRGVTAWRDTSAAADAPCRTRIFLGTIDARLIALDAKTGGPCASFGENGTVDLTRGLRVAPFEPGAYEQTSPPLVVNGLVVVGSAIADNSRLAPASGEVRAFDARTGVLRWSWDPIPQDPDDPAAATWGGDAAARTGAANVWSIMTADPERGLIFAPTSSPAPDYYGGERPGDNRYANSVVALRAATGEVVWHFQTVHHDLWDYDVAAPPALVTAMRDGRPVPAVAQVSKTGMLYVLRRDDGDPVFRIEERPVAASAVPGEQASPTQPFTAEIAPLSPHRFTIDQVWGPNPEAVAACRAMMEGLRSEGIFTPPSREGTVAMPSNIGGGHWGGLAFDPARGLVIVPVNRIAAMVQLLPGDSVDRRAAQRESNIQRLGYEYNRMEGTPWLMRRRFLMANGLPCTPPPFGTLVAVSLRTGEHVWEVPLGQPSPDPSLPPGLGSPNLGGPIVTGGGLVFIGGTLDRAIRAYDVETGRELWKAQLPAGARATPMTYEFGGRQYVVIAAGGGDLFGAGDAFVAFALP